jgi:hypothetical protein
MAGICWDLGLGLRAMQGFQHDAELGRSSRLMPLHESLRTIQSMSNPTPHLDRCRCLRYLFMASDWIRV